MFLGLETGAIIVTAILAFLALIVTKAHYRQKNTLEFMNDYNRDKRVSEGVAVVLSPAYKGEEQANDILKPENRKNYDKFLFLMNEFEILAIGLKHKVYDKEMIKDYFGYDLLTIYKQSKLLIETIRTKNEADSKDGETAAQGNKAYEQFEYLAQTLYEKQGWFCNALSSIRRLFIFSC